MAHTPDTVKSKLTQLSSRAQRAEGALIELSARQTELTTQVAQAKGRQSLHEEVQQVFQLLQARAHERSVGAFERLLSAILKDVCPSEGKIRLGLSIKNNTPALDVLLERDGKLEDVYDDNGGGVTNIVCAGLRFAALSRTKNRRLMILDEPDGWLGESNVSSFVKVLADVSSATKTQTVFISHRTSAHFEGLVNVLELSQQADGSPSANLRQPTVSAWTDDEQPGIRMIELFNVRRHRHTSLPLLPGATALIGGINLGKSTAVIAALKAVCYGESSDSIISHGETEARIVLHLEKRKRLVWSRKIGRSPVVLYELYEDGATEPSVKGRPGKRNEAPDWVQELMGVTRVDDLDIQLGNQKRPVFLLDDTASRRAQVLSVGRESSYLPKLMKEYDSVKAEDRETIRMGEAELMRIQYRVQAKDMLPPVQTAINAFVARFNRMEGLLRSADLLEGLLKAMDGSAQRLHALKDATSLPLVSAPPALPDTATLARLVGELDVRHQRVAVFKQLPAAPVAPVLPDSAELHKLGVSLKHSLERLKALGAVPAAVPSVPALPNPQELSALLTLLVQQNETTTKLSRDVQTSELEQKALAQERAQLQEDSGGLCPLCGHSLTIDSLEGHSHAV